MLLIFIFNVGNVFKEYLNKKINLNLSGCVLKHTLLQKFNLKSLKIDEAFYVTLKAVTKYQEYKKQSSVDKLRLNTN